MSPLTKQALYALSTALESGTVSKSDLLEYFSRAAGDDRDDLGFGRSEPAFIGAARSLRDALHAATDEATNVEITDSECQLLLLACKASISKVGARLAPWLHACA
jgi:hypothetical protein